MARDLSLAPLADLLEEARRRGIVGAESMDRAALIESLSEPRGPMSFARSLIGRVVRAMIPTAPERPGEPAPPRARPKDGPLLPPSAVETLLDPVFTGVRVLDGDALAIVWRVPSEALEVAGAIAAPGAALRARIVRVAWADGEPGPRSSRTDHAEVGVEGALALARRAPGEQIVVAIGLGTEAGDFVAAVHATL